jgi:hypothetical protein
MAMALGIFCRSSLQNSSDQQQVRPVQGMESILMMMTTTTMLTFGVNVAVAARRRESHNE